jgi:chlorite dismutase
MDVAKGGSTAHDGAAGEARSGGVDLREKGMPVDGNPITLDSRLFVQLHAFGGCADSTKVVDAVREAGIAGAVYEEVNDPWGIALLQLSENPDDFIERTRALLRGPAFRELVFKPEYTMLGRSYSMGYEADLREALIDRPTARICDRALRWAVWYPLRRAGGFEMLEEKEQQRILSEHGAIGRAFGKAGYGYDIRLACHGLGKEDNDFVVGLLGPELYPLSAIVQRMRSTRQTSLYLTHLGPFFVGRAVWQSAGSGGGARPGALRDAGAGADGGASR